MKKKYSPGINALSFLTTLFIVALVINVTSFAKFSTEAYKVKKRVFKPVIDKLLEKGADTSFVKALIENNSTRFNEKYVKINVRLRSGKARDYSHNYSKKSVKRSENFIKDNLDILSACEEEYDVPKEVIAAIIWVETRFGGYLGKNHVPSVFLSTALADQPEYYNVNLVELYKKYKGNKKELVQLEKKLKKRSAYKANWALNELLALGKMYKTSPVSIFEIKGSWAGAFGLSQFLPSSYVNWAVDGNGDEVINLFHVDDAIYSVANYLKTNGWGDKKEQKRKAVYHYNHSNAYVDAVLKLAEKLKKDIQDIKKKIGETEGKEKKEGKENKEKRNIKTPLFKQIKT